MPRRTSKRKRRPNSKYDAAVIATPKKKTNRRTSETKRRQNAKHNAAVPATPTPSLSRRGRATPALIDGVTSPSPDIPEFHMCGCGLLHADVTVITSAHNGHDSTCVLHSAESPSCTIPIFKPTTNAKIKSRKKGNSAHLELSAFLWVDRWLSTHDTWPTTAYPWVQWALHCHPTSEFLWFVRSSPEQVAARAEDFAIRGSRSRSDFDAKVKKWWSENARVLLPLRSSAFKLVRVNILNFTF